MLTKSHKAIRHNKDYLNRLSFLAKTDEYTNEAYRRIWAVPVDVFGRVYDEFDICVSPLIENDFKNGIEVEGAVLNVNQNLQIK